MTAFFHRLDENTSLPFKVIVPLMVAIVSATAWLQSTLARIEAAQKEHISRAAMSEWRNELADLNRNLNVPYIPPK